MKDSRRFGSLFALAFLAAMAAPIASCKGSSDSTAPPARVSRKGEACQVTNDCASDLSCLPSPGTNGGVCVTSVFNVAQTTKECAITQCMLPIDCCPTPPSNCTVLQQECGDGGNGGDSFACTEFDTECKCDGSKFSCDNSQCAPKCVTDGDCGSPNKCAGGKCVQCVEDSSCALSVPGSTCVNGACQPPCTSDGDCAGFDRCILGKCVDSGCQTDRECIAATKNVQATCGTDGKCIVPCATDLECGSPKDYSFYSCINKQCTYVGCGSDKDCELYLTGGSDAGLNNPKEHIVCRDMPPGASGVTLPGK